MAAPACAPELEDGELFLPKDIFPDEDDLLLWRGGRHDVPLKEPEGFDDANADYDVDLDLDELATKLAALGLGLGVLTPRGNNHTLTAVVPPSAPVPLFSRCGADSVRFDRRVAALPPRKQQQQPQPPWVLGPRAAEPLLLRRPYQQQQQTQRAAALFAARASALGLPVVDMDGGGSGPVAAGFRRPSPSLLMPRDSSGGRGVFPTVTQGCNDAVVALGSTTGGTYLGRYHLSPTHALQIPVATRRRCGGTGVFFPRVSSPTVAPAGAPVPTASALMKHKTEQHQQHPLLRYHQLQGSSPAAATVGPDVGFTGSRGFCMMTGRDTAPYRALAPPPAAAVDWSSYY